MQPIHIIGVPLDLGGNRRGTDMGPSAFRIAGISEQLTRLGRTVVDKGDILTPIPETKGPGDIKKRYVKEIARMISTISAISASVILAIPHSLFWGVDRWRAVGKS